MSSGAVVIEEKRTRDSAVQYRYGFQFVHELVGHAHEVSCLQVRLDPGASSVVRNGVEDGPGDHESETRRHEQQQLFLQQQQQQQQHQQQQNQPHQQLHQQQQQQQQSMQFTAGSAVLLEPGVCQIVSLDGRSARLWDGFREAKRVLFPFGKKSYLRSLLYVPEKQVYVAACASMCLKIYSLSLECVGTVEVLERPVYKLAFNGATGELVTAGVDGVTLWSWTERKTEEWDRHSKLWRSIRLYDLRPRCVLEGSQWAQAVELDRANERMYVLAQRDVIVFSLRSGAALDRLPCAHKESVTSCVFYDASHYYVTGCAAGEIKVWSQARGNAQVHAFLGHSRAVSKLQLHPAEPGLLLSCSLDQTVRCYSLESLQELYRLELVAPVQGLEVLYDARLPEAGAHVLLATECSLQLWRLNHITHPFLAAYRSRAKSVHVHQEDGRETVVVCSTDNSVRVADPRSGELRSRLVPEAAAAAAAASAAAAARGVPRAAAAAAAAAAAEAGDTAVVEVAYSPLRMQLFVLQACGRVVVFDASRDPAVLTAKWEHTVMPKDTVSAIALTLPATPVPKKLSFQQAMYLDELDKKRNEASSSKTGIEASSKLGPKLKLVQPSRGLDGTRLHASPSSGTGPPSGEPGAGEHRPESKYVGGKFRALKMLLEPGKLAAGKKSFLSEVHTDAKQPGAAGARGRDVAVADAATAAQPQRQQQRPTGDLAAAAASLISGAVASQYVVGGTLQGWLFFWDAKRAGAPQAHIAHAHDGRITALKICDSAPGTATARHAGTATTEDGLRAATASARRWRLVSCSARGDVKVWDIATLTSLATFDQRHGSLVSCISVAPGLPILAIGYDSGEFELADLDQLAFLAPEGSALDGVDPAAHLGHAAAVTAVSFNVALGLVFTAGLDGAIKVWDARSRSLRRELHLHDEPLAAMALLKRGDLLVGEGEQLALIPARVLLPGYHFRQLQQLQHQRQPQQPLRPQQPQHQQWQQQERQPQRGVSSGTDLAGGLSDSLEDDDIRAVLSRLNAGTAVRLQGQGSIPASISVADVTQPVALVATSPSQLLEARESMSPQELDHDKKRIAALLDSAIAAPKLHPEPVLFSPESDALNAAQGGADERVSSPRRRAIDKDRAALRNWRERDSDDFEISAYKVIQRLQQSRAARAPKPAASAIVSTSFVPAVPPAPASAQELALGLGLGAGSAWETRPAAARPASPAGRGRSPRPFYSPARRVAAPPRFKADPEGGPAQERVVDEHHGASEPWSPAPIANANDS